MNQHCCRSVVFLSFFLSLCTLLSLSLSKIYFNLVTLGYGDNLVTLGYGEILGKVGAHLEKMHDFLPMLTPWKHNYYRTCKNKIQRKRVGSTLIGVLRTVKSWSDT